ncbi:hypothetical protein RZS08_46530, partial [Arthrospira platensis SPKY1]|nr:hypothetical protein [Arthrospira platensis SPKY1]
QHRQAGHRFVAQGMTHPPGRVDPGASGHDVGRQVGLRADESIRDVHVRSALDPRSAIGQL